MSPVSLLAVAVPARRRRGHCEQQAHPPYRSGSAQGCADRADRERMNSSKPKQPRSFLASCLTCRVYNRVYLNRAGTAYEGRCPRCRRSIRFVVGSGGSRRTWRVSSELRSVGPRVSRVGIHADLAERVAPEPAVAQPSHPRRGRGHHRTRCPRTPGSNQCPSLVSTATAPLGSRRQPSGRPR